MTLSYAVMAHPDRYQSAIALGTLLEAAVTFDTGAGETANGDHAWSAFEPESSWHCVLQDDAQPIPGFTSHSAHALEYAPRTAVSFYVGTGRPRQNHVQAAITAADATESMWLQHPTLLWGVAVAMPSEHVAPFLRWAKTCTLPYDRRIGAYWQQQGIPVQYTWPSLVDHADNPSLLTHPWGPPRTPRKAWRLGAPQQWNTRTIPIR